MPAQLLSAPSSSRVEAIRARHAALSEKIERARLYPSMSDLDLRRMKKEKLALKEELEGIR